MPHVFARMYEHLLPIDRGSRYEDPLDAFLQKHQLGKLTGGGTQTRDGAPIFFVQVEADLENPRDLDLIAGKLEECGAPVGSELYMPMEDGKPMETRVFGMMECVAVFIDGQTLLPNVYSESDVNLVIANLQSSLEKERLGDLRSYWEGSEETALFFFGANAEAIATAFRPVLVKEALCQNARLVKRYGRHLKGAAEERVPRWKK
jgi:hypothetical protein